MKDLGETLEKIFIEIALAEERQMGNLKQASGIFAERFEDLFTAIAFAEAGEMDEARDIIGGGHGGSGDGCACGLPRFCAGAV